MDLIRATLRGVTPILMNPLTEQKLLEIGKWAGAAPMLPDTTPDQIAATTVIRGTQSKKIGIPRTYLFGALVYGGRFVKYEGLRKFTSADASLVPSFIFLSKPFYPFKNQDEPMKTSIMGVPTSVKGGGGIVPVVRAMFDHWEFDVKIHYLKEEIHETKVQAIVKWAGLAAGLGAFRPSRKGSYGQFEIARWEVEEMAEPEAELTQAAEPQLAAA